jgi:hypothetical protein
LLPDVYRTTPLGKPNAKPVDYANRGKPLPNAKRGWVKTEQGWEPLGQREKTIVALIRINTPFEDIAFQYGITVSAVCYYRRRAGIPRRIQPAEPK